MTDSWAGVVETHTGVVFFLGDSAVKLRKPVRFSFVDLSTPELRRQAMAEEVRLNRRLSPDVYDGVGELVLPDGAREPVLVMRRLPSAARLSSLARAGAPGVGAAVDRIATMLAEFHASCPAREDIGTIEQWQELWDDVPATLVPHPRLARRDVLDRVHARARAFLAARAPLLDGRRAGGCVRDGHGDLLADDIFVLDDGPRILDCLDFDERLRCGDVLLDVAFLAMDLEHLGAPAPARRLLDAYRGASGRDQPASLEHFFVAYRAAVRAKVMALRWSQGADDVGPEVERLLDLADRHLARAAAVVVLVGGLPGSGKTTLAHAVAEPRGWVVLSTDVVRREAPAPTSADRYTEAARTQVYDDLLARAAEVVGCGGSVVLDATWADERWRAAARSLAARLPATLVEVCCELAEPVARERLRAREGDASEADERVRELLAASFAPWPQAHRIDTTDRAASADATGRLVEIEPRPERE